jgi:hypothetical protein
VLLRALEAVRSPRETEVPAASAAR